jgi:hypothetical protein
MSSGAGLCGILLFWNGKAEKWASEQQGLFAHEGTKGREGHEDVTRGGDQLLMHRVNLIGSVPMVIQPAFPRVEYQVRDGAWKGELTVRSDLAVTRV